MNAKIEIITPEIAKQYLKQNTGNYRKVKQSNVALYAEEIRSGRWQFNGEAIRFSKSGKLLDGQHRLLAVVKAGAPMKTLVIYDIDDSVSVYDVGTNRTINQILFANNIPSYARDSMITAAVSVLMSGSFYAPKQSKTKIVEYLKNHADQWGEINQIVGSGRNHPVCKNASIAVACFYLLKNGAKKDDLVRFFTIVNSGFYDPDFECSPCIVLRNTIIEGRTSQSGWKKSRDLLFCSAVQAYNDFSKGYKRYKKYTIKNDLLQWIKENGCED